MKLLGIISVGFFVTGQLLVLIRFFLHLSDAGEKKWAYSEIVHHLFISFNIIQLGKKCCIVF
jgi:heme/copper-type cytochrome/quinol oxidase subunit 4